MFTIASGDSGSDVATKLQKAGVTKSYEAFYTLLLRQKPEVQFQPGVFKLAKHMSAQSALLALKDPASKVERTAVIPEGTAEKDIIPSWPRRRASRRPTSRRPPRPRPSTECRPRRRRSKASCSRPPTRSRRGSRRTT